MAKITFAFDKKSARTVDADGRMRVKDCILSTAEINPYRGSEIPGYEELGLKPNSVYELYRDPEEMRKAAPTFEGVPLMVKHIPQTADAPRKEYQCGAIHTVTFDGKHLRGDLLVSDGYAIELIESEELSDLSCGYRYKPDMVSGEVRGDRYDGVMRDIQGNHVALVDDGRATGAHVADSAFRNPQLPDPSMQGDSKMPFPEKDAAPGAENANPGAETEQPGAEAAPAPGSPAGEQNEQVNMAMIGQALKHIAGLLENIHAKVGGGGMDTAGADSDLNEHDTLETEREGAMDGEEAGEHSEMSQNPNVGEGAMDFELSPAVEGEHASAMDEGENQEGAYPMPKQAPQEGTTARGNPTPHGAMDARTVKSVVAAAVNQAVKQERARAASVEQAKRDVQGVLGPVHGMDSAGSIYREALKMQGVDVTRIAKGAERVAWQAYTQGAAAAAGVRPKHEMALDSKTVEAGQSRVLGHLAKISVKG